MLKIVKNIAILVKVISLCSLGIIAACDRPNREHYSGQAALPPAPAAAPYDAPRTPVARTAEEKQKQREACHFESRKLEYEKLSLENRFDEAFDVIVTCSSTDGDAEISQMLRTALTESALRTIPDKKKSARSRADAIELVMKNAPEKGREFEKLHGQLVARAAQEMKAERKRHGVSIGMSKEDVIASSWGHPESVNKTSTAYGTNEQWVYSSGSYLYFDDGKLTAVQN